MMGAYATPWENRVGVLEAHDLGLSSTQLAFLGGDPSAANAYHRINRYAAGTVRAQWGDFRPEFPGSLTPALSGHS